MSGTPDDSAQYAAFEAEMAQPGEHPDMPGGEPVTRDVQHPAPEAYAPQRQQQQYHQAQQPTQESSTPDVNEDPIGYFQAKTATNESHIGQMAQHLLNER